MGAGHSALHAPVNEGAGGSSKQSPWRLKAIRTKPRGRKDQLQGGESRPDIAAADSPREHAAQQQSNGKPTATKSFKHRSAAFLEYAKRQSQKQQQSVQEFVLGSCRIGQHNKADQAGGAVDSTPPSDTLGLDDVLAVLSHDQQKQQPFKPYNGYAEGPPKPHCHEARVAAADGIQALRTTRDGEIESMLRLLCKVFGVETATVALLTGEAIYITGACGALNACICPDRWGFCGWSFINSHHELLVVEDMDADARFSANFFVIDPAFCLKFYVAAPLISSNGHRLGTLCVMGQSPRSFDAVKAQLLSNLAEMLVRQLEEKWVAALQASGQARGLQRAASCYSTSYLVLDLSARPWRVLHMNEPAIQLTGAPWGASYDELPNYSAGRREAAPFEGTALDTLFDVSEARLTWGSPGSWEFKLTGLVLSSNSSSNTGGASQPGQRFSLTCRPAIADGLDEQQPFYIGVPAWLALSENNSWGRNYFFACLEPEQPQQQQLAAQPAFVGDSVEQLTFLSDKLAVSCCSSSSNNSTPSAAQLPASPADFVWMPRGVPSSQLSSSRSLGGFSMTTAGNSTAGNSSSTLGSPRHAANKQQQQQQPCKAPESAGSVSSGGDSSAASSCLGPLVRGLPMPGLVMGPLLGRGSFGRVYRGLLKGQPVAVKIVDDVRSLRLSPSGEPLEVSLTRDLRQTGIMATLGYAYADAALTPSFTSSTSGSGSNAGGQAGRNRPAARRLAAAPGGRTCWMLFEYCNKGVLVDGVLRGWFRTERNPLSGAPHLRTIGVTALEVAAAMAHLHAQGIMHGDLCGGNVMLTSSSTAPHGFTAKVGDFGLIRTTAREDNGQQHQQMHPVEQRLTENAYGTITHQPPEVLLEGANAFSTAADVYAWGVLVWEMLTGSRAWAGLSAPAVVCQVAVLKRGLAIPSPLPDILCSLLTRALSPQPEQRPSFAEIVERLTRFVQESRAVDWQKWQADADAAHAAEMAKIQAADAKAAKTASSSCPLADDSCQAGANGGAACN